MGAPYSLDLRIRVVGAVADDGMSCLEAAEHYQVSHSSVIRWTKRQAETGSPAALPMGGKKPFALAGEEAWIRERVAEKPDLTGRELLGELNARGVDVSYYGVWHFLAIQAWLPERGTKPCPRKAGTGWRTVYTTPRSRMIS